MAQSLYPIADVITGNVAVAVTKAKNPDANATSGKTPPVKIIIFAGSSAADTSLSELFDFRTLGLVTEFEALRPLEDRLKVDYDKATGTPGVKAVSADGEKRSAIFAATATAQALSKAFSYLKSDYAAGGIDLAEDNDILVSAVAARAVPPLEFYRPTQLPMIGAGKDIYERLTQLGVSAEGARVWVATAKERSAKLKELAKAGSKDKAAEFTALATRFDDAVAGATSSIDRYTALMNAVSSTAVDNPFPLATIVRQRALSEALNGSSYALFLMMYTANGGYFTKKNLWTALGAMPFYASGGAVVHFQLIARADSRIAAAGVVSFACTYRKVSKVATSIPATSCELRDSKTPPAR
jgi:hypothetical protein